MSTGVDARAAIARGLAFLRSRQLSSGEIPVCTSKGRLMEGECVVDPSVFPTALMAHSLSFAPDAAAIVARAVGFLEGEMEPTGFWKHWTRAHPQYAQLPPDLDDTAMAAAVLARSNRPFPDQRKLLLANRDRRGLFRTWRLSATELRHPIVLIYFFTRTSARPFDVDAVVNANVLSYLGPIPEGRPVVEHLLRVLRERRESACDKWYENPFAVWYFFSRALHAIAPEGRRLVLDRLGQAQPPTVLDEALAACSRLYWGEVPSAKAIDSLVEAQFESGGWRRAGLYHGGRARLRSGGFAQPHPDTPWWGSEELTTSYCIEALSRWLGTTH